MRLTCHDIRPGPEGATTLRRTHHVRASSRAPAIRGPRPSEMGSSGLPYGLQVRCMHGRCTQLSSCAAWVCAPLTRRRYRPAPRLFSRCSKTVTSTCRAWKRLSSRTSMPASSCRKSRARRLGPMVRFPGAARACALPCSSSVYPHGCRSHCASAQIALDGKAAAVCPLANPKPPCARGRRAAAGNARR